MKILVVQPVFQGFLAFFDCQDCCTACLVVRGDGSHLPWFFCCVYVVVGVMVISKESHSHKEDADVHFARKPRSQNFTEFSRTAAS